MFDYFKLLERAYKLLPKMPVLTGERFEIPRANTTLFKNKTIILNAKEIVNKLRRDINHFVKFLQKEFGVPVEIEGNQIVISKKLSEIQVQRKVEKYAKLFVICPVCGKPDTVLVKKERGIVYLKCEACGAESPVRYVI